MSFRPSGRDNSDPLATFRVGHVQDDALARAKQITALFAVSRALVNPLDGEWIGERLDPALAGAGGID